MKKYKLRRWVKVVLVSCMIFFVILGASEVDNIKMFFIKSIISLLGLMFNGFILIAFGEDNEY